MRIVTMAALAAVMSTSLPVVVQAGPKTWAFHHKDQIEDRLDRWENRRDEAVDHGRWDVLEDKVDRWEDRRDDAGLPVPPWLNKWERRSWLRLWCQNHTHPACGQFGGDGGDGEGQ